MEEAKLIAEAQAGNREAAGALFERHLPALYRFICARLGAPAQEAEDVLQEALTAAVVSLARFRGCSTFQAWLTGIARHKIADHIDRVSATRRRTASHGASSAQVRLLADEIASRDLTAAELEASDVQQAVADTLGALPPAERSLLIDKYQRGLSVDAIAARQRRTPKSVEAALFRARRHFRELFPAMARRHDVRVTDARVPR